MALVSELNQLHPLDCQVVAQVRSQWAEYHWYYDKGYIRYWDGPTAIQREHQYVAQAVYGILRAGVHVHHIDGNRLNNRADNLAIMTGSGHWRLHHPQSRIVITCPICGAPFEAHWSRFKHRGVKYCSDKCRNFAARKVERPSAEYLAELLRDVGNWTVLGRMFGVSDNAVRKWAKQYGLDLGLCDGRIKHRLDKRESVLLRTLTTE